LSQACAADAVRVGAACIDKYEASAWETTDTATIDKITKGKIQTAAELSLATRRGAAGDDYGAACPDTGNGCENLYAVSIAGVLPSGYATWFQAAAACRNAGKRLATNQEWQLAALGTPDPGTDNGTSDCATGGVTLVNTGSRSNCVSDSGAFDMVGNTLEYVADWSEQANYAGCPNWGPAYGNDVSCFGFTAKPLPGVLVRGGRYQWGAVGFPWFPYRSRDYSL
jgi:hypothetical protein